MVIKRDRLYDVIKSLCNGEYTIGMHGIDYARLEQFCPLTREEAIDNVMENGLRVYSSRTIHGTVAFFGRIDTESDEDSVREGLEKYWYGSNDYYIIAVPCIVRNSKKEELFVGSPNLKSKYIRKMGSTGSEITTLLDTIILEKDEVSSSNISPEFILGKCHLLRDGDVEFILSPKHMAFNGGTISDEFFDKIKKTTNLYRLLGYKVDASFFEPNLDSTTEEKIKELLKELEKELTSTTNYAENPIAASLWETLTQLLNEKNVKKSKETATTNYREEEKTCPNRGVTVELKKGRYFHIDDTFFANFSYEDELSELFIKELFSKRLLKEYGTFSERAEKGKSTIMPYLVDEFGEFTTDSYNSKIGGVNIPNDLLEKIVKIFIENGCTIKVGNRKMKDYFDRIEFQEMLENIPKEDERTKQK